ncbi:MAG: amidase family protein [Gemmatimonadetes bacterium]|nr:amidase family protein [Gemmatimonadota bacterium]
MPVHSVHSTSRRSNMGRRLGAACAIAAIAVTVHPAGTRAQAGASFEVVEATIATVHGAFTSGRLTCRQLVQAYLDRIEAYDKTDPAINSLIVTNPRALGIADSLDRRFAREGLTGPLHCVPTIVKDNFETNDLQTTAGSAALAGWIPRRDATMVARMKAAGAIVLAKSNLAEWAFTPYETVSSILPGYTRNPYDLSRVTAGSSGGTAAAVAASLGLVGLGSDTGNSIRGPSAHQALFGIRSTMGLTSRAGVVPLNNRADIAGPMARTADDAVRVFQVVAGEDPDDSVTAGANAKRERDYTSFLTSGALQGARIGVLRQAYERATTDTEVVRVFDRALAELRAAGATIIDTVIVDSLGALTRNPNGGCNPFKYDLERYFAARGEGAPVKTIAEVLSRPGNYHPTVQSRLEAAQRVTTTPEETPGCTYREEVVKPRFRAAITALMDSLRLDALVHPTWSNPPRLIGDLNTPHGDNSQLFSPTSGFPAITVPMGYTRGNTLPAGMTFLGRAWSEGRLISLAYDYERASHHRRPPAITPPLSARP